MNSILGISNKFSEVIEGETFFERENTLQVIFNVDLIYELVGLYTRM
jgi:hypothetical protein